MHRFMMIIVLFEFLPYVEEFVRALRANPGRLIPARARAAIRARRLCLEVIVQPDSAPT
jgi:hypothetical protein